MFCCVVTPPFRYQAQVNEYKFEIERLQRELQEVKKRYYEQKRREHLTLGDDAADSKGFKLQQPAAGSRSPTVRSFFVGIFSFCYLIVTLAAGSLEVVSA